MTRGLRASWRLARSVAHIVRGVAIVMLRFRGLTIAERRAKVGWWSTELLRLMGIGLQVDGQLAHGGVLLVANHVSWLDITALHAVLPQTRFVSKADVKSWPLLSQLADAAGTLYLQRERKRDALRVVHLVAASLAAGDTVGVFPEGTTSDGRGVLPFHANLLQAAIAVDAPVQPVALRFSDAHEPVSRAVEYIGSTTLAASVWRVARGEGLVAHVSMMPVRASAGLDRRALAKQLRDDIAGCLVDPSAPRPVQPLP